MSLEQYFSGPGAPQLLKSLADCLSTVGTASFNLKFLDLIERIIKADQCMIFSYRDDRPKCCLSYRKSEIQTATNLAQKYLRDDFKSDPLRSVIDEVKESGVSQILNLADLKENMQDSYRETYFKSCGIIDSVTIVASGKQEVLLMNFYRFEKTGKFSVSDNRLRVPFWEIISQLALMHFSIDSDDSLRNPLNSLSKRERDICHAMLNGMTSDAIAWKFESISQYCKNLQAARLCQAWNKLQIRPIFSLYKT